MAVFTDSDIKILRHFVTSAKDPIYAMKHTVPPEMFGAFGSYFSRNPKDFREHLLDAIKGQIAEERTEVTEENLAWLEDGDFRDPSEAIRAGIAKSQDFFKKWYGKYSHKSIANTVELSMVATNVSQLFARELAYDQLAFFIEQSTRYVSWDKDKMYHDPRIMASKHADKFLQSLEQITDSYHELTSEAIDYYKEKNPFDSWLKGQPGSVQKGSKKFRKATYNRLIKAAALDVSRSLLPQATQTNIAWILDARSTEFDIAAWKGHPLQEIKTAANLIEKHAGQIAPSLLKYTKENKYYGDKLNDYQGDLGQSKAEPFEKGIDIISYEQDSLNKVIGHFLKRHNFGGTFSQRYSQAKEMSFKDKISLLRRTVENRGSHDEWVALEEELDLVKITAEIRSDLGAIRDWRRHQKWDRSEPLYTTDNGIHRPYMINDMSHQAGELFDRSINIAMETEQALRGDLPYEAQYIVPMATNHAITMSAGLDQAQYMLWTRSTPFGHFSYRKDTFNFAEQLVRTHPWMLGYESYPKEKEFMQVYEEAPLKKLINLQTGDTALHQ